MRKRITTIFLVAGMLTAPPAASGNAPTVLSSAAEQTITLAARQKTAKPATPAQQAFRARQKKCGAEWKAAKAAGTVEKEMKWPQFWSACNSRLKDGS